MGFSRAGAFSLRGKHRPRANTVSCLVQFDGQGAATPHCSDAGMPFGEAQQHAPQGPMSRVLTHKAGTAPADAGPMLHPRCRLRGHTAPFGGPYPMKTGCLEFMTGFTLRSASADFSTSNPPHFPADREAVRELLGLRYPAGDFSIVERHSRGVDLYFGRSAIGHYRNPVMVAEEVGSGSHSALWCEPNRQIVGRTVQRSQLEICAGLGPHSCSPSRRYR